MPARAFAEETLIPNQWTTMSDEEVVSQLVGIRGNDEKYKEVKPMTVEKLRYSKEEFARRGNKIYQTQIRPQVDDALDGCRIIGYIALQTSIYRNNLSSFSFKCRLNSDETFFFIAPFFFASNCG